MNRSRSGPLQALALPKVKILIEHNNLVIRPGFTIGDFLPEAPVQQAHAQMVCLAAKLVRRRRRRGGEQAVICELRFGTPKRRSPAIAIPELLGKELAPHTRTRSPRPARPHPR